MKTKEKSFMFFTLLLLAMAIVMLSCKKDDEDDDYDDIRDIPDGQVDATALIKDHNTTQTYWL